MAKPGVLKMLKVPASRSKTSGEQQPISAVQSIQFILKRSLLITNLGVKTQRDQCRKAKRRETISRGDEGQQVLQGKICPTTWQRTVWCLRNKHEFSQKASLLLHPSLLTSDFFQSSFPVSDCCFLRCSQRALWRTVANGEKLLELGPGERVLRYACHHRHKHLPAPLDHVPQSSAAVQAVLKLENHTGHPAGGGRWLLHDLSHFLQ